MPTDYILKFAPGKLNPSMSVATMISVFIPPIMIPDVLPDPDEPSRPTIDFQTALRWSQTKIYYKNDLKYDFPSPVYDSIGECDLCGISFEFASTRDNESCVSCEILHRNYTRHNIPLPTCSICDSSCYYIHRGCNKPICTRCRFAFQPCPNCDDAI